MDNLGGMVIKGRTIRVDHARYKKRDDEPDLGHDLTAGADMIEEHGDGEGRRKRRKTDESESEERPMLREEIELAKLMEEHDEEDPMKAFLVQEKRDEVAMALVRFKDGKKAKGEKEHKHRHRHHKSHRSRDERERRRSRSRERERNRDNDRLRRRNDSRARKDYDTR